MGDRLTSTPCTGPLLPAAAPSSDFDLNPGVVLPPGASCGRLPC
jgi:hypothetical protein